MKLNLRASSKSHRVLIFGPPKSGKSFLAGKLSSDFNLLWFDLENGADTLFQLPVSQQERIELVSIPDTRSFPVAIETCLKAIRGNKGTICEAHGKWDCPACKKAGDPTIDIQLSALPLDSIVVFDSLTQLTNSAIAHITKNQPDDYKLTYEDWGNLGKLLDTFLSHVQQAGFHVVCISHETEAEMEDGRQKLVPTAGTRNFSRNTAKYFDEVIYCEVKNRKHIAASSTTYNNNILTGSRSGSSLETETDPSLVSLFKGEKKLATTTASGTTSPGQATPANKSLTTLQEMRAKLGAPK